MKALSAIRPPSASNDTSVPPFANPTVPLPASVSGWIASPEAVTDQSTFSTPPLSLTVPRPPFSPAVRTFSISSSPVAVAAPNGSRTRNRASALAIVVALADLSPILMSRIVAVISITRRSAGSTARRISPVPAIPSSLAPGRFPISGRFAISAPSIRPRAESRPSAPFNLFPATPTSTSEKEIASP